MNGIDNALRLIVVLVVIIVALNLVVISALLLDVIFQVPVLDELSEVGLEGRTVLNFAPILLVVGTELALISGGRVTLHQLRPFEEGL